MFTPESLLAATLGGDSPAPWERLSWWSVRVCVCVSVCVCVRMRACARTREQEEV